MNNPRHPVRKIGFRAGVVICLHSLGATGTQYEVMNGAGTCLSRMLGLDLWLGCVRRRVPVKTLTLAGLLPRKNLENVDIYKIDKIISPTPPASNTQPKIVNTSSKAVCSKSFRFFIVLAPDNGE